LKIVICHHCSVCKGTRGTEHLTTVRRREASQCSALDEQL